MLGVLICCGLRCTFFLSRVPRPVDDPLTAACFEKNSYSVPLEDAYPVNPEHMAAAPDNTELMYLHDPSLLNNITQRYEKDAIYTFTGSSVHSHVARTVIKQALVTVSGSALTELSLWAP